jgi:hypothetical protein
LAAEERSSGRPIQHALPPPAFREGSEAKPGSLNKAFYTINTKAESDYLVYNEKMGVLYYDADGSGAAQAVEFATVSKNLKITYKDFFIT